MGGVKGCSSRCGRVKGINWTFEKMECTVYKIKEPIAVVSTGLKLGWFYLKEKSAHGFH